MEQTKERDGGQAERKTKRKRRIERGRRRPWHGFHGGAQGSPATARWDGGGGGSERDGRRQVDRAEQRRKRKKRGGAHMLGGNRGPPILEVLY